jgi:DnaD/phage-associated family protein
MKKFDGFPARMEFTSVPNVFFSSLLPQIEDIAELKVTLHVFKLLYRKKGYPRFVTLAELLADSALVSGLKAGDTSGDILRESLEAAAGRGTLLHLPLERDGVSEDIYLLNDEPGRQAAEKMKSGDIVLKGLKVREPAHVEPEAPPNIFTLYEENIGMLTPMIADEIRDAEKLYPESWLRDAIREAVSQGKRKWSVVSAILQRWSVEGRIDGAHQRDSKKTDPDKYVKGKYGHMVRR